LGGEGGEEGAGGVEVIAGQLECHDRIPDAIGAQRPALHYNFCADHCQSPTPPHTTQEFRKCGALVALSYTNVTGLLGVEQDFALGALQLWNAKHVVSKAPQ
jgi:hypothetical protein